jgi:hypothetical protein
MTDPLPSWRNTATRGAIVAFVESVTLLQRLAAMADQDPTLRDRQPWKAAHDQDHRWLGDVITKHTTATTAT